MSAVVTFPAIRSHHHHPHEDSVEHILSFLTGTSRLCSLWSVAGQTNRGLKIDFNGMHSFEGLFPHMCINFELTFLEQIPFKTLFRSVLLVGRQEGCLDCKNGCSFVGGDDLTGAFCTSYSSSCHHHFHQP